MRNKTSLTLIVVLVFLSLSLAGCLGPLSIKQAIVPLETAQRALELALSKQGASYVWGGNGPDEFDCFGLITWSYKQALGRADIFRVGNTRTTDATIDDLWRFNVELLPQEVIARGDIVFIPKDPGRVTHGGLFIRWVGQGEFEFINASSHQDFRKVVVDTWPVSGMVRDQWLAGAGRLKVVY